MNRQPKVGTILRIYGAGVRLFNVLNPRFGKRGLKHFIKEWPAARLRREVRGFGPEMLEEWRALLGRRAAGSVESPPIATCPFCGETGRIQEQHRHFVVICSNEHCGVKRQPELSPLAAVTVWNERHCPPRP